MKFEAVFLGGLSGSVGGLTASRNRFGGYFKTKPNPVNPNTDRQQSVRSSFSSVAHAWVEVLDQAQRDIWITYADNVTVKDAFGRDIHLTGYQMYMRTNTVVDENGLVLIADGPTVFTKGPQDATFAVAISAATQLMTVTFDDTEEWVDLDNAGMVVRMSIPQSASVKYLKRQYRIADIILGDSGTPLTSPQTMTAPWEVAEDQQVLCQARIVLPDGRLSDPFRVTVEIAA